MPPRNEAVDAYIREVARLGGHARAKALTAKRRTELARKAVNARWKKARAIRSATHTCNASVDKFEKSA